MPALRTQIYLTREERRKLDARRRREGKTLAAVIRDAVDAYVADTPPANVQATLDATFGVDPDFTVPPRDEWERRLKRVWGRRRTG